MLKPYLYFFLCISLIFYSTFAKGNEEQGLGVTSVSECDRLAAHPEDPDKVGPGKDWDELKQIAPKAITACAVELSKNKSHRNQFQLGRAFDAAKLYSEAIKYYYLAIEGNYIPAFYNLGRLYEKGHGVNRDYKKAFALHKIAAEANYRYAMSSLANLYQEGKGTKKNFKLAFEWYEKGYKLGDTYSANGIGYMYHNGLGVKRNYKAAIFWYKRAIALGSLESTVNLGFLYETGKGVRRNYKKARELYLKAAQQNQPDGQNNLGSLYFNGKGVRRNRKEAYYWHKKAADQGHELAQKNLRLYKKRKSTKRYNSNTYKQRDYDRETLDIMNNHMCNQRGIC